MVMSSIEKKMREMATELREGIIGRAEKRHIEIENNVLIDFREIEERFDINPQWSRFSFDDPLKRKIFISQV